MKMKIFTEKGEQEFKNYLQNLKKDTDLPYPNLNISEYILDFEPEIEIDEGKTFTSRLELAKYLTDLFNIVGIGRKELINNNRLWTWLTFWWFDQICPIKNGERKVQQLARYICSKDFRTYYRHFVASTYNIFSVHGEENSLLFLYTKVNLHNDFIEQLASRQDIISFTNLISVAHRLYWDKENRNPKPSSSNRKKAGNLRRLIKIFSQLDLTYDIYSLDADQILDLLPVEFDVWKI